MKFHYKTEKGRSKAVIYVDGFLEFPYLLVDVELRQMGFYTSWEYWLEDARFPIQDVTKVFIIDGKGVCWSVIVGNANYGLNVPVLTTDKIDFPIELSTLIEISKENFNLSADEEKALRELETENKVVEFLVDHENLTV